MRIYSLNREKGYFKATDPFFHLELALSTENDVEPFERLNTEIGSVPWLIYAHDNAQGER